MRVGPYELLEEIGRGGNGAVHRARAPDGAIVAVKLVRVSGNAELVEREARLQKGLGEKEGFVEILDVGTAPGGVWLAMPLLEGGTLRDRLRRGPLPVEETLALGRSLARGLAVIHGRGIVHRDMKPENVLFDRSGRPFIADLGLAKHFRKDLPGGSASLSLTGGGAFKGTVGYAAPEQLADAASAGPPADVFGLGAILYECLAGAPAFAGESPLAVIERVDGGSYEPLARARPGLPRGLVHAIERALERDPADRFADGAAFLAALEPAQRRRGLAPVLALSLLVLAGVAIASFRAVRELGAPSPIPVAPSVAVAPVASFPGVCSGFLSSRRFRLLSVLGAYDGKVAGTVNALVWLPDGRIVTACGLPKSDRDRTESPKALDTTLTLWDGVTGRELRRFRGHTGGVTSVVATPDGARLVSGSYDQTIRVWDVESGQLLRTIDAGNPVTALACSAGRPGWVVAGHRNGKVALYDLERRKVVLPPNQVHRSPVHGLGFAKDGRRVFSGAASGGVSLWPLPADLADQTEESVRLDLDQGVNTLLLDEEEARLYVGVTPGQAGVPGVDLYDLATSRRRPDVPGPSRVVRALGSDGRRVLAGGLDGTIVVHDAATLAPLASLEAHAQVHALACSPDKKRAVSGGLDGELHFWSLERLAPTGPGPFASRRRIALSPDGKLLAWGNLHGEVGVTDLARGVDLWRARVHAGGVMDVELSSDGKLVATAGKDGFARVWGLDGALVLETPKAPGVVQRAVFSPDSRKLVACGAHGLLAVTDLATRETLSCPGAAESGVMAVAFLPDGRTFVTGSSDRSLQLWNLDTRAASGPRVTDAHAEFLCNVVVSPGGTRLMSSAWDHTVKVWDAHSLALVRELPGSERVCWALAFLDERRALVGSYDGLLRLWDVATGEVQDELSIASSTDAFLSFALAPDRRSFHASTERGVVLHFGID